ncbi:MAG: TetR/AcrR family transcriptional regulator [Sulfitobacter sp.]
MTELPRRALNRIAREKKILDAALTVFAGAGFSGASMEAVAQEAGISKPTLYQYFPNKQDLFGAMMMAKRDTMLLAIEEAVPAQMVPQLYRFATSYAQTVMRPDLLSLARLIIGEAQRFPQIGRAYQAAGPDQLLDGMSRYLLAQRAAGRLQFDHAEMAAEDLWGLVLSAPRNRALYDPEAQISAGDLHRFVANGLQVFLRAYSCAPVADLAELQALAAADTVNM